MKANYNQNIENKTAPMDRESRRSMHKRLRPKIKRIVELEKQIKAGVDKEAAEAEMTTIIESLSMVEMFAVEDYIYNKQLLDNKK